MDGKWLRGAFQGGIRHCFKTTSGISLCGGFQANPVVVGVLGTDDPPLPESNNCRECLAAREKKEGKE
jgi:hypothetical protein